MRILLQQKGTGLYFEDIGSWIHDSRGAMDFLSSAAAIDFCGMNQLQDVQLVMKFDEQEYEIVVQLAAFRAEQPVRPRDSY